VTAAVKEASKTGVSTIQLLLPKPAMIVKMRYKAKLGQVKGDH
jgi:hypothetical protein